jgi:hypothetical protein
MWFLGQPDQALDLIHEALTLARELSEPHGLAHSFFYAAILHQLRREERLARERAEDALAVSSEHGLAMYQAFATITLGWALSEQGLQEGLNRCARELAAHEATGTRVTRPHFWALLADALRKAHKSEEGLAYWKRRLSLLIVTGKVAYLR